MLRGIGDRLEAMPTFSPDGRRIAFVAVADGFKQIFIREVGGGATAQLTRGDYDHIQPAWGPMVGNANATAA